MSLTDKVRRKLESDDPKCANCSHWKQEGANAVGLCGLWADVSALRHTTDLSLCSAWEQKID